MDNQTTLLGHKIPALLLYQKNAIIKANYLHATANGEKKIY